MQSDCDVELGCGPLSDCGYPLLENSGEFLDSQIVVSTDELYFALNVANGGGYPDFGLIQFVLESVSEE